MSEKGYLVIAGDFKEYAVWCRENNQTIYVSGTGRDNRFIYNPTRMLGLRERDWQPVVVGTWKSRGDRLDIELILKRWFPNFANSLGLFPGRSFRYSTMRFVTV